jgi:hypothetical protein
MVVSLVYYYGSFNMTCFVIQRQLVDVLPLGLCFMCEINTEFSFNEKYSSFNTEIYFNMDVLVFVAYLAFIPIRKHQLIFFLFQNLDFQRYLCRAVN